MTLLAGAPIIVGVDDSEDSHRAVALAAQLAADRARVLRVVHAFVWPYLGVPLDPSPVGPPDGGLRNEADRIVADAVAQARQAYPKLEVVGQVLTGAPASTLLAECQQAAAIVLGHRGLGGFTGMLIGSVAVQVTAHASCPVVISRGDERPGRDILVGVDASPKGADALAFAYEEASLREVGITALHAYRFPASGEPGDMLPLVYDDKTLRAEEDEAIAEALAGFADRYPDVRVNREVVRDRPAHALVRASESASLVVVGSRGRGGFTGLLLGSVSQALLRHAACPVAVVR